MERFSPNSLHHVLYKTLITVASSAYSQGFDINPPICGNMQKAHHRDKRGSNQFLSQYVRKEGKRTRHVTPLGKFVAERISDFAEIDTCSCHDL